MLASFFEFVRSQFHALNHHHQVIPMYAQRGGLFIKMGQLEAARFQLLVVDHHPGIFHVKDLHDVPTAVDENKYPAIADILLHRLIHNAAQGIEALAHIYRHRVQVVLKGFMEMEHTINLIRQTRVRRWARSRSCLIRSRVPLGYSTSSSIPHRYSRFHEPGWAVYIILCWNRLGGFYYQGNKFLLASLMLCLLIPIVKCGVGNPFIRTKLFYG